MALVLTVPQLIDMSVGAVPEAFRGVVKSVQNPMSSKDPEKPWKMQKAIITGDGKEIEIVFDNREDVPKSVVGSTVYVSASTNAKGGLSGTKRKEYNGKPQVAVYESAEVSFEGGRTPPPQRTEAPPARSAPPTNGNGNGHGEGRAAPPTNGSRSKAEQDAAREAEMRAFNRRLGRAMAGLLRCYDAAYSLVREVNERHAEEGGFKPGASDIKEIATCLFIQAQGRNNSVADIADFPLRGFHHYEKPADPPPAATPPTRREGAPFQS